MATMSEPIRWLSTLIQISNKSYKFQLNKKWVCISMSTFNICAKFQVDMSFLPWVLFSNLMLIFSIWQRPWNHSTNICTRIRVFFFLSYALIEYSSILLCLQQSLNKGFSWCLSWIIVFSEHIKCAEAVRNYKVRGVCIALKITCGFVVLLL